MSPGSKRLRRTGLLALAGLLISLPGLSLEPVFTRPGTAAVREVRVCILLLQATRWENPEPYFLPTLASDSLNAIRELRPANWNLTNPLAPPVVTREIANLWDRAYAGPVTFGGLSAQVDNTTSALAYNTNPNTSGIHTNPTVLDAVGVGGTDTANRLPAVGSPIPRTHPAYWEVPLTPATVSQLANFDAVFVNTHRNLSFTDAEQRLLRQFLDAGGTLFLEDSHGCRIEVVAGGSPTNPADVDFFVPFQFVDGWPARGDGYPLNGGGITSQSPNSKSVVAANHPLLNALHTIGATEAEQLGDVLAWDHLLLRQAANYPFTEILRTGNTGTYGQPTGTREPAIAVVEVGSGKLVLSGVDMIDDCSKAGEGNREPTAGELPDLKFMFNLLAWRGNGHRRGGPNNSGEAAGTAAASLSPKFVWYEPTAWTAAGYGDIALGSASDPDLPWDPNVGLKEPLCVANGIVYLQSQDGSGDYWLTAIDADPESDLDGDGRADDGLDDPTDANSDGVYGYRDMEQFGASADTIWRRNVGGQPILGATVTTIQEPTQMEPVDVLLFTQAQVAGADSFRITALHATVDLAVNTRLGTVAGAPFAGWTGGSGGFAVSGATDITGLDGLDPRRVSGPVVSFDKVYVTASANWGLTAPAGEWLGVACINLVDDPATGTGAGFIAWSYPGISGVEPPQTTDGVGSARYNTLKIVDPVQHQAYVGTGANFVGTGGATTQFAGQAAGVVPYLTDTVNLTPTVATVTDERTGLTAPWVFLNRPNGDVWAVCADEQALGWRIEGEIQTTPAPTLTLPSGTTLTTGADANGNGLEDLRLNFVEEVDPASGATTVVATELLVDPLYYRSVFSGSADATYTVDRFGTPTAVTVSLPLYPRARLLRGNRHSGYESAIDEVDLLGWSTGAPLAYDAQTIVATSSPLWRGANYPTAGTAYNVWGSGPVTFFDAGAAGQSGTNNDFGAVKWVFDPGSVAYQSYDTGTQTMRGGTPNPAARETFGVAGSPVRYGDSVVVAAQRYPANPASNVASTRRGAVLAIDPNPVLAARLVDDAGAAYTLDRRYEYYLLNTIPTAFAGASGELLLASLPTGADTTFIRAHVIDPAQYTLDFNASVLSLKADEAHLTRLADPLTGGPAALRVPLYGRLLWLVEDRGGALGSYDAGDRVIPVYVPSPCQWLAQTDTILLNAKERIVSLVSVRELGASGAVSYTQDADRPALLRLNNSSWRGKLIEVTYTTPSRGAGNPLVEVHRVPGELPGFCFSPVVAGDRLYVSGLQVGSQANSAIPTFDLDGGGASNDNGGLYVVRHGQLDHVVDIDWLRPDSLPVWPSFAPTTTDAQYVRGAPVVADEQVFVSFGLVDGGQLASTLYALGGSQLLVTESQRVARVDVDGRVLTQFAGVREWNPNLRTIDTIGNTVAASELVSSELSRPAAAYNLSADRILVVDTGHDRVLEVDRTGLVIWPRDSRTGHPDGNLRYLGLRNLGLNRPRDAVRFTLRGSPTHPNWSAGDPATTVDKDVTVIADTGNRRLVAVVSYPSGSSLHDSGNSPAQAATPTYYEPLRVSDTGYGAPWELTSRQVYNPTSQQWVELAYVQVQAWDPAANDNDPRYNAGLAGAAAEQDRYLVTRVAGSDQLFNVDPDPDDDGNWDNDGDGVVDGVQRNLGNMLDQWSNGMIFRGLRAFHRFRIGTSPYLAVIKDDPARPGGSHVLIYRKVDAAGGYLSPRWEFTAQDYDDLVYDPTDANPTAYYRRQGAYLSLRQNWWANGTKAWNPVGVYKLPHQNLLAIVNGSPNSVNQTASNSEVLLIRVDPTELDNVGGPAATVKRVEHVLPDLWTTSTYPAGQEASRRRPETGSYPVSSPVAVHQ